LNPTPIAVPIAWRERGTREGGIMVNWMQIMVEVRRLDDKQKRGEHLSEGDAAGLVAMLLDFHHQAVVKVPTPSRLSLKATGQRKGH
jgi:hypothetical protein